MFTRISNGFLVTKLFASIKKRHVPRLLTYNYLFFQVQTEYRHTFLRAEHVHSWRKNSRHFNNKEEFHPKFSRYTAEFYLSKDDFRILNVRFPGYGTFQRSFTKHKGRREKELYSPQVQPDPTEYRLMVRLPLNRFTQEYKEPSRKA